jgi:hypothetical protein
MNLWDSLGIGWGEVRCISEGCDNGDGQTAEEVDAILRRASWQKGNHATSEIRMHRLFAGSGKKLDEDKGSWIGPWQMANGEHGRASPLAAGDVPSVRSRFTVLCENCNCAPHASRQAAQSLQLVIDGPSPSCLMSAKVTFTATFVACGRCPRHCCIRFQPCLAPASSPRLLPTDHLHLNSLGSGDASLSFER